MIRLKLIRVFQQGVVGPIRVYKRARPADAPKPLNDPEQVHAQHVADCEGRSNEHAEAENPVENPSNVENLACLTI